MTDRIMDQTAEKTKPESDLSSKPACSLIEPEMHTYHGLHQWFKDDVLGEQAKGLLEQTKIEIEHNGSAIVKDAAKPASLEQLSKIPQEQLARLYHDSPVGQVPSGDMNGRAIVMPGSPLGAALSDIADLGWKGKIFEPNGELVNKIFGQHIIKAEVSNGTSWFDGKPSTIIDYGKTSLVAGWIRDEIREVNPGLYLGVAYARLPFNQHVPALFFALDENKKQNLPTVSRVDFSNGGAEALPGNQQTLWGMASGDAARLS